MKQRPFISVIMPVYNGEAYLKEAIDSILSQTYTDFEFIILNDGSADKTEEIILSYDDPRIVYINNETNLGIVRTLNKGIDMAKGKFIARMDADDISLPERFEKQVAYLQHNNACSAVFAKVETMDEQSQPTGFWDADRQNIRHAQIAKALPRSNPLAHPTLMTKTDIMKRYRYDYRAKGSEDYCLWLTLVADGHTLEKIDEVLLYYRIHANSITRQSTQGTKGAKKQLIAKFYFLSSRCRRLQCRRFERDVVKGMLNDGVNMLKIAIKNPLRSGAMRLGRALWHIYPKRFPPLDILFIFKNADMGGAERVQLALLKALQGFNSMTLLSSKSTNKHFLKQYEQYTTIKDISRYTHTILGRWIAAGYMQQMIEKSSVKVVFGSLSGLFYDIAMDIETKDTVFADLFHACDNNIEYYSLDSVKRLDRRIVIDGETKTVLSRLYDRVGIDNRYQKRMVLIHNGVAVATRYPKDRSRKRLKVLFVGRDVPVKRVHLLRRIAQKLPSASFLFVGVPPHPNDPANVEAVGEVEDVSGYYKESDILLLASEREGFPMVVMEAMAQGVIPVCTDVGGIATHIVTKQNGILIESGADEARIVQDFVDAIMTLRDDVALSEDLSLAAYRYAKEHFDIERFNKAYTALFHKWVSGQ